MSAVNEDGTYAIDYDDGDKEPNVDESMIRDELLLAGCVVGNVG